MRTKLIVANWKMNFTVPEALKFFAGLRREMKGVPRCEVVIVPPFTVLYALEEVLKGSSYQLGAQNMHWEETGAYTGEISPLFLKDLNVLFVLLGHSERREYFGETTPIVNKKLFQALKQKLTPIVCVGENLEERRKNETYEVLEVQIKGALDGQMKSNSQSIVWAYEPKWAIGTGKNATPEEAQAVSKWMRNLLSKLLDPYVAEQTRLLYGGSVSEKNAAAFVNQPDIDGLLVGGASLDPDRFSKIIQSAETETEN